MELDKELDDRIEKELFDIFELRVLRSRAVIAMSYTENSLLKKAYKILMDVTQNIIELQEKDKLFFLKKT